MIKIISKEELAKKTKYTIGFDALDFPIEEETLDYIIEEYNNKTFLLVGHRLIEVVELY